MNELLALLLARVQDGGWLALVVFLRVGAALALLPGFGSQMVPVRVKLALAGAFTAIVAPAMADTLVLPPPDLARLAQFTATETLAGLALGVSVRLFIWALQVAGVMAAQATSLSQLLGAEAVDPQPAIAQTLQYAGLTLAVIAGLHIRIAEAFILSYETLPAGRFLPSADLADWGIARVAHMFELAFTYAAPFLIASLIYNLALGVINRAMPQLMVAFVGAPVITMGGLVLLMLSAPILLPLWVELLNAQLANPFGMPP